jgi:hypothetical protein
MAGAKIHSVATIIALVVFSVVMSITSSASDRPCTITEAKRAETEADSFRSWKSLYKAFKLYGQCDDGAIAEGYSESVARTLVDHWQTLPQLGHLERADPQFRRFVIKHVDETLNAADFRAIAMNANNKCPIGLGSLCRDLRNRAESP